MFERVTIDPNVLHGEPCAALDYAAYVTREQVIPIEALAVPT